ncbi:glycosyltransferase [Thermosulfuriphilus ammonigenes]|uniref:Glycosyltransferase n=1 Tax=Thermosulfuriphilus ammonigenes TaxID=1936021 RepID=A0A6G7PTG2_9BACT|nr:glycosyltransferase [Thermosulfuriphilus ammonigenes]MBA2848915.1 glycosyltransferase involved in cell wall biosynthesis [Thermosulfuriphilus ammonigenes]QIJ70969.1 glycosyltransferase [Thermosulfuriphilus ammonigenes]
MPPLVSVIIPTHNRKGFLKEAVESVLAQRYRHFELIVVDDGSTDGTEEVIKEYPSIIYLRIPQGGVSRARNRGLEVSRGEIIAFLDSDDLWLPEKLLYQVAFFQAHPSALICQTEEIWFRHGRRVNPRKKHRKLDGFIFFESLKLCLVSPSAVAMRRELFKLVGTFDEDFPVCEDYDLWLRVTSRFPVYLLRRPLVIKRGGHKDQLSRRPGLDFYRLKALAKIYQAPHLSPAMREAIAQEAIRKAAIFIAGAEKRGRFEAVRAARQILALFGKAA